MTTSWNETKQIEAHLQGAALPGDALVFEAQLVLDNTLADKVIWQEKTYSLIQQYGRRQLKKQIEQAHQQLFTLPAHTGFAQKIWLLFNNK